MRDNMQNKFNIEEEIKNLPPKPGVYIMHDKNNNVIYVGKAISLKKRVTSYFRKTNKTERIKKMVSLVDLSLIHICSGREAAIRSLQTTGLEISSIKDVTPIPHNGCRPPKRRRV